MGIHIAVGAPAVVAAIEKLHREAPKIDLLRRDSGPRREGEFDPNLYFSVLPHLSLRAGYMLDYVYDNNGSSGSPWIYARKTNAAPLSCRPEIFPETDEEMRAIAEFSPARHIVVDGSPDGWFELLAFQKLAGQFYLFWHAIYNSFRFLVSPQSIEEMLMGLRMGKQSQSDIRQWDTRVEVTCMNDRVQLSYCGFSAWKGFTRYRSTSWRTPPYALVCEPEELVHIPYHCGMVF